MRAATDKVKGAANETMGKDQQVLGCAKEAAKDAINKNAIDRAAAAVNKKL